MCAAFECFSMRLIGQKQIADANLLRAMFDVLIEFIYICQVSRKVADVCFEYRSVWSKLHQQVSRHFR